MPRGTFCRCCWHPCADTILCCRYKPSSFYLSLLTHTPGLLPLITSTPFRSMSPPLPHISLPALVGTRQERKKEEKKAHWGASQVINFSGSFFFKHEWIPKPSTLTSFENIVNIFNHCVSYIYFTACHSLFAFAEEIDAESWKCWRAGGTWQTVFCHGFLSFLISLLSTRTESILPHYSCIASVPATPGALKRQSPEMQYKKFDEFEASGIKLSVILPYYFSYRKLLPVTHDSLRRLQILAKVRHVVSSFL